MPDPWETDATQRLTEFIEREYPDADDLRVAISFARRLGIDPFDAPAKRDPVTGQWWSKVCDAANRPDYVVVASYGIDVELRRVHVTAFTYLSDNFA